MPPRALIMMIVGWFKIHDDALVGLKYECLNIDVFLKIESPASRFEVMAQYV
jgi:hypothetical protein